MLLVSLAFALPVEVPPPNRLTAFDTPLTTGQAGTRVGMIVVATDEDPLTIDVSAGSAWITARETFRLGTTRVMVADLGTSATEVRLRTPDPRRITSLDWDLIVPMGEPKGPPIAEKRSSLPSELTSIGVISRASWGARDTTCTSLEDDWYRMAIHHSAGTQTYGGTVTGEVQVLQAYAQDSGEYCDIPYQFLVGYDGSLYEGRPYGYYSGATGGGNNDGNIAVCFLGCYHPSDCPNGAGDAVTDAMMEHGQELVQTLVTMNAIPSDADSIRGHRDWPDNATACPGDWLYARLDELREPLGPDYAGSPSAWSCPMISEGTVSLELGAATTCTLDLVNTGGESWTPGSVNLGTLPRDSTSTLTAADWVSTTRLATIGSTTAPGATGRFTFTLQGNNVGTVDQYVAPLAESITWFADDGGPADYTLGFRVEVTETPVDTGDPADTSATVDPPGRTSDLGDPVAFDEIGGCGCQTGAAPLAVGLLTMGFARRRGRSRPSARRPRA